MTVFKKKKKAARCMNTSLFPLPCNILELELVGKFQCKFPFYFFLLSVSLNIESM